MNATTIPQGVNMTRLRVMVFARTVLISPLVTHVTSVYHTIMKLCIQLTIQTDAKVSSESCLKLGFFKNTIEKDRTRCRNLNKTKRDINSLTYAKYDFIFFPQHATAMPLVSQENLRVTCVI